MSAAVSKTPSHAQDVSKINKPVIPGLRSVNQDVAVNRKQR